MVPLPVAHADSRSAQSGQLEGELAIREELARRATRVPGRARPRSPRGVRATGACPADSPREDAVRPAQTGRRRPPWGHRPRQARTDARAEPNPAAREETAGAPLTGFLQVA